MLAEKWVKKAKIGFGNLQFPVLVVGLSLFKLVHVSRGASDVLCRGDFMSLGSGSAAQLAAAEMELEEFEGFVDEFAGRWVSQWIKENSLCEAKRHLDGKVRNFIGAADPFAVAYRYIALPAGCFSS